MLDQAGMSNMHLRTCLHALFVKHFFMINGNNSMCNRHYSNIISASVSVIWYMYSIFQEIHLLKNQRYAKIMIAKTNWNAVIFLERFLRQTAAAAPIDSIELLLLSSTRSDAVLSTS